MLLISGPDLGDRRLPSDPDVRTNTRERQYLIETSRSVAAAAQRTPAKAPERRGRKSVIYSMMSTPTDMTSVVDQPLAQHARTAASVGERDAITGIFPPVTPDGRYIVARGRLWRRANPALGNARRTALIAELMGARSAVGAALRSQDSIALLAARGRVHAVKVALGDRGSVWWTDGAPDQNHRLARNTSYND